MQAVGQYYFKLGHNHKEVEVRGEYAPCFTAQEALLLWNTVCPIMLECSAIRLSPANFSTFAADLYLLPLVVFCRNNFI